MTTDITELAQSLKAAADREMICRDGAETSEIWERTVTPENILALVEALESEKRICATWRKTAESTGEKLEKAQAINAAAEKLVRCKGRYHSEQNYRALAALFGVKTPDLPPLEHENVHYADAAEMEIAALRQRIAELESRTVTVKLASRRLPSDYVDGEFGNDDLAAIHNACRLECKVSVEKYLSAHGIVVKWEAE
ncbi:TPA: ead/Ea22-like family protein [Klebsiella pneumoniae]|uniref:ead/Ea22-like family protein n=1 Tax=Klebsiella pneumoniae TaxID=573 RepID=UPI00299AAF21|nr:ead/Ea22-like family protein [Klebsiella pneumoniae]HBZ2318987.1 ead/Ea22-like family protein [Klebsiella pneumoniae]HBZ2458847.1 ead/Ea22-like family protein [Klebsiella pneumoniae]HBZ2465565.1 ead/Ea22-like family protein [Klebsiella pneumoniae]HCD2906285.1 ead/Ea22-like family protein [Klebsiella pneumoniae]